MEDLNNYQPEPQHDDSDDNATSQPATASSSLTHPSKRPTPPLTDPHPIPDSVRGAPEELKPAIRKKQNKESARRSRRKRKELVLNLSHSIGMLVEKTQELETRLDSIETFLSKSGFESFPQPRLQYPVVSARSLPSSDAGPSHSGSLVLGSDGGSQSHGQPASGSASAAQSQGMKDLDDDDVERLIASCLEQL